jgi:serine/threonine protein phosphatase PrpC
VINCPNPSCQTANPEESDVCQVCRSMLPHYYLWGTGSLVASLNPGQLLNQRYLLKRDRIFLDTKPGLIPESLPELPDFVLPYLHLSAYPLHVPRPYAIMRHQPAGGSNSGGSNSRASSEYGLMLESSALLTAVQLGEVPAPLPSLNSQWAAAPPLRQLSWLHQISQLWDAFQAEQVAQTLLENSLVRVDGSIVRLLALTAGPASNSAKSSTSSQEFAQPTLMDLGKAWQPWAETAHPAVRAFLERLCESLERQQLSAEQLADQLSLAIAVCTQDQRVSYDLAVYTDQGPTRKRNEDACYPASGTTQTLSSEQTKARPQLLIVCDGIGGHQGGDVASKLAISTIESRLQPILTADTALNATELTLAIESAICAANDEISAQNDQAQRQARDRMGTTLVLALVKGADVYVAHLGDSRAYRVSAQNCQQVTLDDDVASRQVRLGGSLYREVLLQPGSGSLIQALGMGSSQSLRPTVQRFVLDESCVFLLCSDGLSDSDRVEQFWQKALRPLVIAAGATADAGKHLIDLANRYNGHDNVTVGLLSAQVISDSARIVPRELAIAAGGTPLAHAPQAGQIPKTMQTRQMVPAAENTRLTGAKPARSNKPQRAGIALALLLALGGLLYFLFPGLSWRFKSSVADAPSGVPSSPSSGPSLDAPNSGTAVVPTLAALEVGSYARIRQSPGLGSSGDRSTSSQLLLYPKLPVGALGTAPGASETNEAEANNQATVVGTIPGVIPTGGIVKVVNKQQSADQSQWVQLELCSIPSGATSAEVPAETDQSAPLNAPESTDPEQPLVLSPGSQGWIIESKVAAASEAIQDLQPSQQGNCER